ncbi:MAG: hypothetical protein H6Q89_2022 [Myxococcaceae bacterium]|nr:hypothetical protein [Myxococcaceae bacterium]
MSLVANTQVTCPACGKSSAVALVRSINTQTDPAQKAALMRGELNVLSCECGKRTPMAADLLFHDPVAGFFCQVCVGDAEAIAKSKLAFEESGVAGDRRIVRSMNALMEKVKLLDAGLKDWAIEMVKVLLLTTLENPNLDEVLLFDGVDRSAGTLSWLLFRAGQTGPQFLRSPLASYERGLDQWRAAAPGSQLEIDRAWALASLRKVMPLPV